MPKTVLFENKVISISTCAPLSLLMAADEHGISPSDALRKGIEVMLLEKEAGQSCQEQKPASNPNGEPV